MPLPITTLWQPSKIIYAIVFNEDYEAWNDANQAFEPLEDEYGCGTGEDWAIELTEHPCVAGLYTGSAAALAAQGDYLVVAFEQGGGTPDLSSDTNLNGVMVAYDGSSEITLSDIDGGVTNIEVNGGLTGMQNRMLTNIYNRKNNNQRR